MKTYEIIDNNKATYIKEACTKSLEKPDVDCVHLYYYHRLDLETPIEKAVKAMIELKKRASLSLATCS